MEIEIRMFISIIVLVSANISGQWQESSGGQEVHHVHLQRQAGGGVLRQGGEEQHQDAGKEESKFSEFTQGEGFARNTCEGVEIKSCAAERARSTGRIGEEEEEQCEKSWSKESEDFVRGLREGAAQDTTGRAVSGL